MLNFVNKTFWWSRFSFCTCRHPELWLLRASAIVPPSCKSHQYQMSYFVGNDFDMREKKFPQPPCKSFSYWLEISFHFSRCGNAIFAFKASLVRFTFTRIFKVHKNFRCWIYFSSKGFVCCFRLVQSETIWFKIENVSEENINVSVRKKFSKISWKTEQASRLSK